MQTAVRIVLALLVIVPAIGYYRQGYRFGALALVAIFASLMFVKMLVRRWYPRE